jgi:lipoate-protein ligase A
MDHVQPGCCILYLWQNKNTVVIGRNQNAWTECRTELLESEGGFLARRLSGGGAVFHDLGNLNFTFIMSDEDYDLDRQFTVIQQACAKAGIHVVRSGRNDLLAGECKFSGNAFYHSNGHAYHHGTLLVNADMEKLSRYLTPSKAKLQAKGVQSVRSRVVNLQTLAPSLTIDALKQYLIHAFSEVYGISATPVQLTTDDIQEILHSAAELGSWDWLYGKTPAFTDAYKKRFPWGGIELLFTVHSGVVEDVAVYSDTLDNKLVDVIKDTLVGVAFNNKNIVEQIKKRANSMDYSDTQNHLLDIISLFE